jgi:MinD superfamily P-loop ATPase
MLCEGCGLCPLVCPVQAIQSERNITGTWYVSDTAWGPMVHARLGIAEENSGRLVAQVRDRAATLAEELHLPLILGDGPPGTGCPVIASVTGTDLIVIVTEPTVSGVHDMERVLKLSAHFRVPAVIVINKADLNEEQARRIEVLAAENHSRVIGRIPFDREVNDALMAGKTVIEYGRGSAGQAIREIWSRLQEALGDDTGKA